MKQVFLCSSCGGRIDADFEIVFRDGRVVGKMLFPEGVFFAGEVLLVLCKFCNRHKRGEKYGSTEDVGRAVEGTSGAVGE